jgi:hypothetical protein
LFDDVNLNAAPKWQWLWVRCVFLISVFPRSSGIAYAPQRMRDLGWGLFIVGCVISTSCTAARSYFIPTGGVLTEKSRERTVARYTLTGASGPFGDAMVWSDGSYDERHSAVLELRLSLRNSSSDDITLSAADLRLESMHIDDSNIQSIPHSESGVFRVPPGENRTLALHFILPEEVSPFDLRDFVFVWLARSGAESYGARTTFERQPWELQVPPPLPATVTPM